MNEEIETSKPIKKNLKWELKDSSRNYWNVTAKYRATDISQTEENFYETIWNITVEAKYNPKYKIAFTTESQYNSLITIDDIAMEVHSHIMQFYNAALTFRGLMG